MRTLALAVSTIAVTSWRRRLSTVGWFALWMTVLTVLFSILFHVLMELEGRDHSWLTGLYWTMTVMTTLGFGDITFTSDLGRMFSVVVMLTGVLVFQVFLTFMVIQHIYLPWMEAAQAKRLPRTVAAEVRGHVLCTADGPLARAVVEVHVFDFNEDLYGRHVRVEFVEKIRDEEKYEGLEALKRQIALDCAEARRLLADSRNH